MIKEHITTKLSSAKWILTVLAGWSFSTFCIAIAYIMIKRRNDIDPAALVATLGSLIIVIQNVYKDYFNRKLNENDDIVENPKIQPKQPTT